MRLPGTRRTELRTLRLGLAVLACALAVAAGRPADRVAAINEVAVQAAVATLQTGAAACQPDAVPADAERVRVPAEVARGAVRARAVVEAGGRRRVGEWAASADNAIVVPLPPGTPAGPAEICVESAGPGDARLIGALTGEEHRLSLGSDTGTGRMRLEYLYGNGPQPLWGEAAGDLPERVAAATGSAWAPWVAGLGIVAALCGLVALMTAAPGRREILAVAVLALGSGMSWAAVTPLFQATDELAHAAYVQALAELGHPPRDVRNTGEVSQEMACWATVTRLEAVRFFGAERPPWRRPSGDPCEGMNREKDAAQYQAVQPPAYYAMAAAGYRIADALGRPLPDRLLLARLVSALLAAVTVVSAFLVVREALPGSRWPARAGALVAGLQPVAMFNHSMVNSDALVIAAAAASAAVLARIWRRGPTLRRALLLGAVLGIGILAKITFLLVVPCAVAVQAFVFLRRSAPPLRQRALLLVASWTAALVPALGYAVLNDAIWEPSVQNEASVAPPVHVDKAEMASYVWQAFLPPLPFMEDQFPTRRPPVIHAMIVGPTSRLGYWDDYGIGSPWSTLIAIGCVALVAFAVVAAARRRSWRLPLAVAAGVAGAYVVMLVAALYIPGTFQVQGRYVLPLLPLWALAAGVTVAVLRERLRGHAVALLAVAMLGWWALAAGATLSRWYL